MKRIGILLAVLALTASAAKAQELPRKVENVTLTDIEKNPNALTLPHYGEKNLMIFYLDSEARNQNKAFTYEIEEQHLADSPNIFGFGIINIKDSMWPASWIRSGARGRTKNNGGVVLTDNDRILADAWELGDCNNQFVLLFVNKAGELVFMRKGELTEQDKQDFYKVIDRYK